MSVGALWATLLVAGPGDARAEVSAGTAKWEEQPAVGATLWAGGSGVNLRAGPAADAPVVAALPLGAPVTVLAVDGTTLQLGEHEAAWLQVRAEAGEGFVWGGSLTGASATRDLNGDGAPEVLTLVWRADHHLALRVTPVGAPATQAAEELDLGTFSDIEGPMSEARLSWTEAAETGVPLVKVFVPGREMCGSGDRARYVAWSGRRLTLALETTWWSDAPVWTHDTLTFDPAKRRVTLVNSTSDDGEAETLTTTVLGWNGRRFVPIGAPRVERR